MRTRKSHSNLSQIQEQNCSLQQELKILAQAIQPRSLNKDLKNYITSIQTDTIYQIRLVQQNDKNPLNAKHGKKSTVLPIMLYLLFTHKKLSVQLSSSKYQSKKQNNTNQTDQLQFSSHDIDNFSITNDEYVENFMKEKKHQSLMNLLVQKMKLYRQENLRSKKENIQQDKKVLFKTIELKICDQKLDNLEFSLKFLQQFLTVLSSILRNQNIKIQKISLVITTKLNEKDKIPFSQFMISKLGWYFWKFIFEIKDISSIEVKIPHLQNFMNCIPLIAKLRLEISSQKQFAQNQEISEKSKIQRPLANVLRIQLQDKKFEQQISDFKGIFVIPLIEKLPNLKIFILNVNNEPKQTLIQMKRSAQLFQVISKSNQLLQNLYLTGFQLLYDDVTNIQTSISHNQDHISNSQISDEKYEEIDKNLVWLQKMQENCPYLSGVRLQFFLKSQSEERRMQEKQRKIYLKKKEKTNEIMNLFYHRGMNNQTYFNTIKILMSQGFDYESILGVLDKISPFTPL